MVSRSPWATKKNELTCELYATDELGQLLQMTGTITMHFICLDYQMFQFPLGFTVMVKISSHLQQRSNHQYSQQGIQHIMRQSVHSCLPMGSIQHQTFWFAHSHQTRREKCSQNHLQYEEKIPTILFPRFLSNH